MRTTSGADTAARMLRVGAEKAAGMNSAEPWLSAPSPALFNSVLGFISFMENKLDAAMSGKASSDIRALGAEQAEIAEMQHRLEQLHAWRRIMSAHMEEHEIRNAQSLLYLAQRNMGQHTANAIVDGVEFPPQKPQVLKSLYEGHRVTILTAMASNPSMAGPFYGTEAESEEKHDITEAPVFVTSKGYIFEKCLRRVAHANEQREIYTGYPCDLVFEINNGLRMLVKVVPKVAPNTKLIIKRVGKIQANVDSAEECKVGDNGGVSSQRSAQSMNDSLRREFKAQSLLTDLRCPEINELLDYFEDTESIYSVSRSAGSIDLMDMLANYVKKYGRGMPEGAVKKLLRDAVKGLLVAHNVGVAHRDVSLENMVVGEYSCDVSGSKEQRVQIIDWGHCTGLRFAADSRSGFGRCLYTGPLGKARYMSPELIVNMERLEAGETVFYDAQKADVFAFGVCLFSMLLGQMPFENVVDVRGEILRSANAEALIRSLGLAKLQLSHEAVDILNKCMAWNEADRASMADVLEHPFFRE